MIQHTDPMLLQLVDSAQQGNAEAFAAIYQRYSTSVFRTAYLMLGEASQAEDVTEEVFVRLHQKLNTFQPDRGTFGAWLHRMTINACSNTRRRWRSWLSLDRLHTGGLDPPSADPPLVELALESEEQRRIWQAVRHLSLKLRAVIVLRYYHDLSYEEIAQTLACPVGTVRSRLHAAHDKLRRLLEE